MISNHLDKLKLAIGKATCVKKQIGKGYWRQLWDIVRLPGRSPSCNVWDYYDFRLYDEDFVAPDTLVEFAGSSIQEDISQALNPRSIAAPGWDKLVCMAILRGEAFTFSKLKAVYRPRGGIPSYVPCALTSSDETMRFLRNRSNYPMFTKPSYGQGGVGSFLLSDYDVQSDRITHSNGTSELVQDFVGRVLFQTASPFHQVESGYLFQDVIDQHRAINAFQGREAVSGLRVVVLNDPAGPKVLLVTWKLAMGSNVTDNFTLGAYGNLVARVNLETGRADFAVNAMWPDAEQLFKHPVTGNSFAEFTIPFWREALDAATAAARFFPLMRIQHWDVAVTNAGPELLELNELGGTQIHQMGGQGILTHELREFILAYGNLDKRPLLREACLAGRAAKA